MKMHSHAESRAETRKYAQKKPIGYRTTHERFERHREGLLHFIPLFKKIFTSGV
ncbi:Uncharacterised protein [uncultured archaeon]|nr:Uncharacterised protein [uncultured archaeon]